MILGIESSCDDSSVALYDIKNLKLIYHKKISQDTQHSDFGGVVPELAARLHTKALPELLNEIVPYFNGIKAVAVTNEPGLSVSLVSGVAMAKSLSVALNVPLIAINHLAGHIYSLFLESEIVLPLGVLLVSGGHTMVLEISTNKSVKILAKTSDDSFGESFDKVAKMLNLGYPGGAVVQDFALKSKHKDRFKLPIPLLGDKRLEYSFSGLKNATRLVINELGDFSDDDVADVCYAFENSACAHIMDKLKRIFSERKFANFGVVGGASANINLRSQIANLCDKYDSKLLLAPLDFCADNAAMIARAGREKYIRSEFIAHQNLQVSPRSSEILI